MPVIGFLDPRSSPDSFSHDIAGFHQGRKDIGFIEDENVAIEYAWSHDQFDRLPILAADLVSRPGLRPRRVWRINHPTTQRCRLRCVSAMAEEMKGWQRRQGR